MTKQKTLAILGGVNVLIAAIISFALGFYNAINFEVAYFCTFLVAVSSYLTLKNKIKKDMNLDSMESNFVDSTNNTDLKKLDSENLKNPADSENNVDSTESTNRANQINGFSKFALGVRISLGLYRIFAYVILAVGVILLMDYEKFRIVGYVIGVVVCLASIAFFKRK